MRSHNLVSSASLCLCALLLSSCASNSSSGGSTPTPVTPVPSISSISPTTITAGAAATALTVNGANFTNTTTAQVGGVLEPTTYVSNTQLTAAVPASQLTTGGSLSVIVTNSNGSSGSGGSINLTVNNPSPTLSSIVPSTLTTGGPSTSVSLVGAGFDPATVVQVNGSARSTTFVSATQVNAILTAADLSTAGTLTLLTVNPAPGGGTSLSLTLAVANPAPGAITLNPSTVTTGGTSATTITVTGTNFVSGSTVQVAGTNRATTFVSAAQLTFQLTVADQVTAAKLGVTVVNPGGGTSASATLTVAAPTPAPSISSISPTSFTAGAATTTLTVNGADFTSSTTAQVGGTLEPTTYISSTQLTAAVPASQLTTGGSLSVIVTNSNGSSASGSPINLTVNNPAPTLSSIVPSTLLVGGPATSVSLVGTGFDPATTVQVNGSARSTTFVSATQVNAILTASDLATAGTLTLMVVNPAPGGGTSSSMTLAVANPAPGTITLTPSTVTTGATSATTITVAGTNFVSGSTVQVAGTNRATTFVSATQLTFQLTIADQTTAARLSVTVVNPSPGGGTSAPATLTVAAPTPAPVLAQVSPAQFTTGSAASTVAVLGSNLQAGCNVLWNGSALSTTTYTSTYYGIYLAGAVPASLLANVGTASITVSCPTAPAVSNALTVSITNPPAPTLTSISPTAGPINTATTITLYGTGFTNASTVTYNGTTIASTYVGSTSLTVALPGSAVTLPGNGSFTVTTPAPGGGTTAALMYTAYIGIVNNSMVYNPVNGLFYVSVPSSAGAPYGNSIVSVDPETGALGIPMPVGSEPNKLALTADGNYLWVALDGASAVRKLNLTTGLAGSSFSLGGNGGIYATPPTVSSLAALPGATDSVIVGSSTSSSYNSTLAIYDSGVMRGTANTTASFAYPYALQVDGSKSEIYVGGSTYSTFTYNSSGITLKANGSGTATFATYYFPEMQVAGGRTYTDFGGVYDAESGALLGTRYSSGTTVASGPTIADTTLGKVFTLDGTTNSYSYSQIQAFNISDFNLSSTSVIPVNVVYGSSSTASTYPTTLMRWGANGLAFRSSVGVFSVRSNLVKDLSTTSADLSVGVAASGGTTTSTTTTYTATVRNLGPSTATNVALVAVLPTTGTLTAMTPSAGSCSSTNGISCNLGSLSNGSSATVTFTVLETAAGSATLTLSVSGSETDPTSSNNQASATVTVTGSAYNVAPAISSISPAAILAGSTDTTLTVTGTGFASGSTVSLAGTALPTSYTSSTKLTATIPASAVANLGWGAITVVTPMPGGGTSNPVALSIYSVLTVGVNHIIYEPFSRKVYASVGSGSSTITGNSIAAITPETSTIGTPVNVGSQPTKMAISDDGNVMYVLLGGANSVARFNLQTQTTEFSFSPSYTNYGTSTIGFRDVAVQTGSENTIAVDFGYTSGMGLFDINPTAKTAAQRGTSTGVYTGTSLHFYNPQTLYLYNSDTWGTLDNYPITSAGFAYNVTHTVSTLLHFGLFQLVGKIGYADAGGVADITTSPATQLGFFAPLISYGPTQKTASDTSLGRSFFLTSSSSATSYGSPDGIVAYDQSTYMPTVVLPLNMSTIEGSSSFSGVDLVRWGQDGLAALTTGGHIYLLRGAAVVPQLLYSNSAAVLTSSSAAAITHGAGNTLLTLTGSNFVPGVAVTWNGSYRTTTIVDATHVTVAIPTSDLTSAGTASLVATNPGASASGTLAVSIN